jgi:hypothetical protein
MSDKLPFFAAESGTWKTTSPNPHIDLSGTALSFGLYPVQTFASAAADTTITFASGDTVTAVVWKDASNWKRYEGAVWTDAATDTLDLSTATLMGVLGTISGDDNVSVVASLPVITPTGIGAEPAANITTAARTVLDDATVGDMVATLGGASSTGTGGLVRATSPVLITPALGTPASGSLENCSFAGNVSLTGALKFTGTGTTTFTTPEGTEVQTKIAAPLFNPGDHAQLVMMGLPASASLTSRALSIIDARSSAHQPTLAVFNPNETDVIGLSWDGANTDAFLKTLASSCSIRVNETTVAKFYLDSGTPKVDLIGAVQSPTFVTPALGTPTSGNLSNCTNAVVADAAITLSKMANLAQDQFIGRTTASTGVPETATITAAARTVLDDTTTAAMRATLDIEAGVDFVGLRTGYIDGALITVTGAGVGANAISVSAGTAGLESGGALTWTSALTLTSLTLSADTLYNVYVYSNSGTPTLDVATTAPDSPYQGTARSKTGSSGYRYLGSLLTGVSDGSLYYQRHYQNNFVRYLSGYNKSNFKVLSSGTATTYTDINLNGCVPITGIAADLLVYFTSRTYATFLSDSNSGEAMLSLVQDADLDSYCSGSIPCDSSQNISYKKSGSDSGIVEIYVLGYHYLR